VLERDVDSAQKAYDQALQRFSQTSQESQSGVNDASLLTAAVVPFESTRRSLMLTVPFAAICGFFLSVLAGVMLEHRAPRIRGARDLDEWFHLPVLGAVSSAVIKPVRSGPRTYRPLPLPQPGPRAAP
jgi:succinoglycan biosynthesis transport protein ExoP